MKKNKNRIRIFELYNLELKFCLNYIMDIEDYEKDRFSHKDVYQFEKYDKCIQYLYQYINQKKYRNITVTIIAKKLIKRFEKTNIHKKHNRHKKLNNIILCST